MNDDNQRKQCPGNEVPTLRSLVGSVPNLTSGVESVEYIRRKRDRLKHTPWSWGDDSANSLDAACVMVESFLANEMENGPGWVVVHGSECYDIDIRVRLTKQ